MNQAGNHSKCCETPENFAKPVPWVGLYAAIASVYLGFLLLVDFIRIMGNRKNLFTPKWFQLNATNLTILAIATKLPVDLTTRMPDIVDQLSKLTGSVLISTAVTNFTLSIGNMDPSSIFSNVAALAILVITVIVNICIQLKTGVIHKNLLIHHILVMVFTLLSLLVLVGWALVVPALRTVLKDDFSSNSLIEKGHGNAGEDDDGSNELSWWPPADLEKLLKRSWLLSLIRRPVVGWRPFHLLSMASSLLGAFILYIFLVSKNLYRRRPLDCPSDYDWSTIVVVSFQGFIIVVDFIGRVTYFTLFYFRMEEEKDHKSRNRSTIQHAVDYWNEEINDFKYRSKINRNTTGRRKISRYFIKILFLKAISKVLLAMNKPSARILHFLFKQACHLFVGIMLFLLGVGIVLAFVDDEDTWIKIVPGLIPIVFIGYVATPHVVRTIQSIPKPRKSTLERDPNLEEFVGQLKGVPCRVDYFCRRRKDVEEWIMEGSKEQPTKLKDLIQKSTLQGGFPRVARIFDSRVRPLDGEGEIKEPENCWILPIITLVFIAINIPGVSEIYKKSLKEAVGQGLKYVRFVEDHLDSREASRKARKEAHILWKKMVLNNKWYDEDLQNENAYQKLEDLANKGEEQYRTFWRKEPEKATAWYNMYKIAKSIRIQPYGDFSNSNTSFVQISDTISDIITACLTNLPRAIYVQCTKSDPLVTEEEIREAAFIFGETREVMTSEYLLSPIFSRLQGEMQSNHGDDRRFYIDHWITEVERLPPRPQDN